jgi:cytochrome c553
MLHQTHLLRWTAVLVLALVAVLVVRSQANAETNSAAPVQKQASTWSGAGGCARCQFSEVTKAEDCAPVLKSGSNIFYLKSSENQKEAVEKSLAVLECADAIQRIEVKAGFQTDESGRKWLNVEQFKSMSPWGSKVHGESGCPVMQKTEKPAGTKELTSCQEKPMNKLDLESWGRPLWQEVKDSLVKNVEPVVKERFVE